MTTSANITYWLESSLKRVFPNAVATNGSTLELTAARGEKVAFQACFRSQTASIVEVGCMVSDADELETQVRLVECVPVRHYTPDTPLDLLDGAGSIPGLVPDPLMPVNSVRSGPWETHSFWITIRIPKDIAPDRYSILVRMKQADEVIELKAVLHVNSLVLQNADHFPVTHWFYADALCDFYKVEPWEDAFWLIAEKYFGNLVAHGSNSQYVPLFTPPTDGVKRPTQLLHVAKDSSGKYSFDFRDVLKWTTLAEKCGAKYFEWTHLFTQWGAENAIRIYADNSNPESLLWPPDTLATSRTYRDFLSQFLPEFEQFLKRENLLHKSFLHLSDEPHKPEHMVNYRKARLMLREIAPWMKVMDALSEVEYWKEGLTDIPVPALDAFKKYADEGVRTWCYYCGGPRFGYVNRLMDTPLSDIRKTGWLFYKLGAKGFLHWGYNYWYYKYSQQLCDTFADGSGHAWGETGSYGNPFVVYPGEDGPIDSVRWEVFGQSMQDYALLHTLGISADDPMLSEITAFNDFPRSIDWTENIRRKLLSGSAVHIPG